MTDSANRASDANNGDPAIMELLADPSNIEDVARAHWLLGCEAERRCDWEDAVEHYLRVVALAPADRMVCYWGHNNLAYSLLLLGRFAEAELHCQAAIKIDQRRHNAHKNLGLAYEGLGRPVDAAASFLDATFRCSSDERAWLHLQKLLTKYPDLLAEEHELAESMEVLRQWYQENGGVPALN